MKIYRRERENSVSEESVREKNRYFEENERERDKEGERVDQVGKRLREKL